MNDTTASLLQPLGFAPETLPARGKGKPMRAYVLRLPDSKLGLRAVVRGRSYTDVTEDATARVVLWMEDELGGEFHVPVHCKNVGELAQQFRDGVWDGFGGSTLSLKPRTCTACRGVGTTGDDHISPRCTTCGGTGKA